MDRALLYPWIRTEDEEDRRREERDGKKKGEKEKGGKGKNTGQMIEGKKKMGL